MNCEVVNYLLETYSTDMVIAEIYTVIIRFTQPLNRMLSSKRITLAQKC